MSTVGGCLDGWKKLSLWEETQSKVGCLEEGRYVVTWSPRQQQHQPACHCWMPQPNAARAGSIARWLWLNDLQSFMIS